MDEVFGVKNFVALIPFRKKTMPLGAKYMDTMNDYLIWHCKDYQCLKYRQLYQQINVEGDFHWKIYEDENGTVKIMSMDQVNNHSLFPKGIDLIRTVSMKAPGYSSDNDFKVIFENKEYAPPFNGSWITNKEGLERLKKANRLFVEGNTLTYKLKLSDYPLSKITNFWMDTIGTFNKVYVVQTNENVIQRCLLMTTDPGDLVFDLTCGSGTTAYVAKQWGRRWITCDTSRVALALAKQRLMTPVFDYYKLAHPQEGVSSGFIYKTVPHITLKSIANNEPPATETFYDQPFIDKKKIRVSGPFTVEAVPSSTVKPLHEIDQLQPIDESIVRSEETLRQSQWRDELSKTGIRGKSGQKIEFIQVEPLSGTRWLHAIAETKEDIPKKVVVSFVPEYAPLDKKQVELAIEEASLLVPKPKLIVFASFQFDPEAARVIDQTNWPGVALLKVQMNTDLFTEDLKKKRSSNESFMLIGQPDVLITKIKDGENQGKYQVEVLGFDYYNPQTGNIESGGTEKIAMWMLDPDYDGRSLFPKQVFFPIAGENEG
jgi:adenine-specific DNA-methyltransferase